MDFVFELLFEIILEGCIELTGEKKVPLPLRILCAIFLVAIYGGLIGILLFVSIANKSGLMLGITGFIALLALFAFVHEFKKWKKK